LKINLKEINKKHMFESDKWFRMYVGVSSTLIDYRDDIVYIKIENTERQLKSDVNLASKIITSWKRDIDSELKIARGFVIYMYKTNKSTGFTLVNDEIRNNELKEKSTNEMNVKEELELINIFSGIFD